MTLIFQFGSNPTLSRAELTARFPHLAYGRIIASRFYIVESSESPAELLHTLGGVVKIFQVLPDITTTPARLGAHIIQLCSAKNKVTFGISSPQPQKIEGLLIATKRAIQQQTDRPVRAVVSREPELSSATVHLEKLLPPDGVELLVLHDGGAPIVAQTVAVQAFDEWSYRDYGRPGRDAKRGMLPPKLAKMMLNIALGTHDPATTTVYDPFCGSGTVLIEAGLLGVGTVFGSDISKQAIDDSKLSVAWANKQLEVAHTIFDVFKHDATTKPSHIKPRSVECIVAETFLGRPLKTGEKLNDTEKQELVTLYRRALQALFHVLTAGGRVVLALPFQTNPREFLPLKDILRDNLYTLDPILPSDETVLYARPDQRTGRQIIRLIKKA